MFMKSWYSWFADYKVQMCDDLWLFSHNRFNKYGGEWRDGYNLSSQGDSKISLKAQQWSHRYDHDDDKRTIFVVGAVEESADS